PPEGANVAVVSRGSSEKERADGIHEMEAVEPLRTDRGEGAISLRLPIRSRPRHAEVRGRRGPRVALDLRRERRDGAEAKQEHDDESGEATRKRHGGLLTASGDDLPAEGGRRHACASSSCARSCYRRGRAR